MSPRDEIEDLLPLTHRTFLILWAPARADLHGYALLGEVEELSRGRVTIMPASLYEAVATLAGRGLIEETEDDEDGRRRTYRLTDLGRQVVLAEARRLEDLVGDLRSSVLAREMEGS